MTLLATQPFMRAAAGGGGGLHFRNPVDVFADAAARTAAFGTGGSVEGEHVQFAADRTLAIVIGTIANPTNFQTYTGDSGTYDDTAWVNRTDAVQGRTGRDGTPGGGAFAPLGVYGRDSIGTADDVIWHDMGFDWPTDVTIIAYRRTDPTPGADETGLWRMLDGEAVYGAGAPEDGTIGANSTAAQRRSIQDAGATGNVWIGKNAAGRALMAFSATRNNRIEFTFRQYIPSAVQGRTDASIQALIDATNLSALQGQVTDAQIPDAIARDTEIPTNAAIDGRADARVVAGVKAYARTGGGDVPDGEIPAGIARDAEIATYARATNPTGTIPDAQIPDGITRDTEAAAAYAALTGATFTGAVEVPAATADENPIRKDTFDALVARVAALEGTAPVGTHTRYAAFSPDATFDEAEWLAGNTSMTNAIEFPATTVQHYKGFAIPATETSLTDIRQAGSAFNTRNAYDPDVGDPDVIQEIDGVNHKTYIAKAPDFAGTAEDFVLS